MKLCLLVILFACLSRASLCGAGEFDPAEFWAEPADLPFDDVVLEQGGDGPIAWRSIVYTSEIYNGEPMRIFAWFAWPAADGPHPAVLSIHGGGGGAELGLAKAFARAGYACLSFDWNTFNDPQPPPWKPGDKPTADPFTRYGNLRYPDWARQFVAPEGQDWKRPVLYRAIAAARRGLTWLSRQKEVDAAKLVVEGHSWGGFLAQLLAGIDDRPKATVSSAAILGWRSRYEQKLEGHTASLSPEEFAEWEKRYDAALYAQSIKAPIFIRCGVADFFGSIDTLPAYWDKIAAPKALQLLASGNHTFSDVETRVAWFDRWLNRNRKQLTLPVVLSVTLKPGDDGWWDVRVLTKGAVRRASVAWTTGPGPSSKRAWAERELEAGQQVLAGQPFVGRIRPDLAGGPLRVFANAYDLGGMIVSSLPVICEVPAPAAAPDVVRSADLRIAKAAPAPAGPADWPKEGWIGPFAAGPEVVGEQSATFSALWDDTALHLRVRVKDWTPWNSARQGVEWYNADSLQLRLRTDPQFRDDKAPADQQRVLHLGWYPGLDGNDKVDAVRGRDFKGKVDDVSPVSAAVSLADDGSYTLTTKIPWSFIDGGFKPEPGRRLKFALMVNFGDIFTDERVGVAEFNNAVEFGRPEAWGEAELAP